MSDIESDDGFTPLYEDDHENYNDLLGHQFDTLIGDFSNCSINNITATNGGGKNNINHMTSTQNNALDLSGVVFPVGGMRRVSSCYFSIASNISNEDYGDMNDFEGSSLHKCESSSLFSEMISKGSLSDKTVSNIVNNEDTHCLSAGEFLYHDILMNVFSYLDAHSLAAFSETAKQPNFECFYFLELQLQRALLVGANKTSDVVGDNDYPRMYYWEEDNGDELPFIAGTGVISRLASMDETKARKIVQIYLDSNSSMQAMPLSHSLAYIRQVLRQYGPQEIKKRMLHPRVPSIDNQILARNARNMAIFFTFLGAASLMHGAALDGMTVPDPSDIISSEKAVVLRDTLLKMGLAGGVLKTILKRMKDAAVKVVEQSGAGISNSANDGHIERAGSTATRTDNYTSVAVAHSEFDDDAYNADQASISDIPHGDRSKIDANIVFSKGRENQIDTNDLLTDTSASMKSLEQPLSSYITNDFPQRMPPLIASEIYSTLSTANPINSHSDYSTGKESLLAQRQLAHDRDIEERQEINPSRITQHRSKRSHIIHRDQDDDLSSNSSDVNITGIQSLEPSGLFPSSSDASQLEFGPPSTTAAIKSVSPPFSPNPYAHFFTLFHPDSHKTAVSISSFPQNLTSSDTITPSSPNNPQFSELRKVPSGCIGAYAHAVKSAASEVTRLVKQERRARFDALSQEDQIQLGIQFIDACSSDDKLSIVKDILQKQGKMDVDRFFIGLDDTETCGIHAAAFNGAENILKFLSGGICEHDSSLDAGLCDVDIQDANGWTALHFAAGANSVSSVRILAEHGAKLTVEAGNGYTPFHWAERLSNEEVALELEKLGADNRFVGRWIFGPSVGSFERTMPFVSYIANQFFGGG